MPETQDALLHAVRDGDAEAVRRSAAASPALLDRAGPDGRTPLMLAAAAGQAELAALLLELGADPAQRDEEGRTAADLAVAGGHADLGQRLGPATEADRILR